METRPLRTFQTVAELGSLSRAAELLRLSQPAVSRQIATLEAELGRPLLRRHGHGVALTEAGHLLLERAQAALRQLEQAAAEIRGGGAGLAGTVTLALPPAAGTVLAPPLLQRVRAEHPSLSLKILGGFSGHIHEWLVRGQVDLACVHDPLPQRGFVVTPLVREDVLLVGRREMVPKGLRVVRIDDLRGLPLVLPSRPNASRRLLDAWAARKGIGLDVRVEVDDHLVMRALVRQGIGFTLLTRGAVEAERRSGPIDALPFRPRVQWELALIAAAQPRREMVAAVGDLIRRVTQDLVRSGAWQARAL